MRKRTVSIAAWGMLVLIGGSTGAAQDGLSPESTSQPAGVAPEAQRAKGGDVPIVLAIPDPAFGRRTLGDPFVVVARNVAGKEIVAWGVQVFERDRKARLRPTVAYELRPRPDLVNRNGKLEGFVIGGPRPAFEARPTFAVFEDGSWAGNAAMARREIGLMRAEYVAVRSMRAVLEEIPGEPRREDVVQASLALVRAQANAVPARTRLLNDEVLRILATALNPERPSGRARAASVAAARAAVNRHVAALERLTFVTSVARP